jgi:hypothetical protein
MNLDEIRHQLADFAKDRNWDQCGGQALYVCISRTQDVFNTRNYEHKTVGVKLI